MKLLTCLFFTTSIVFSCHNKESESDRILREFDSVNRELERLPLHDSGYNGVGGFRSMTETFENNQAIYDSLEKKFAGTSHYGKIRQMYYTINDFEEYVSSLVKKFKIACGDSTGDAIPEVNESNVSMTNDFFLKNGQAGFLMIKLRNVQTSLLFNARGIKLTGLINDLVKVPFRSGDGSMNFMTVYFNNMPPFAAVTILRKFEHDIIKLESLILNEYLKQ